MPWTFLGILTAVVSLAIVIIGIADAWNAWVAWVSGIARFFGRIFLRREYSIEETELDLLVKHNQALVRSVGEKSHQLGELHVELKTAKEKEWKLRLDRIRDGINAGYSYSQREEVQQLISEIRRESSSVSPDHLLVAQIYRVAAIAYLPKKPGGDYQICKRYLAKAEKAAEEDETINLHIIKALVALDEHKPEEALKELRGHRDAEAVRLHFSILLELDRIQEAQSLIENEPLLDEWVSPGSLWHAALSTFYAIKGEKQLAIDHLEKYRLGEETADRHRISGGVLFRVAQADREKIVKEYNLFPEFAIALNLDDLVDKELVRQAANDLFKAGQLFESHQCDIDAVDVYSSVVFTLLDIEEESELLTKALVHLESLKPDAPAIFAARCRHKELNSVLVQKRFEELEDAFQRVDLRGHLKLSALECFTSLHGYHREAISLLRTTLSDFRRNPSAYTHGVLLLVSFLKEEKDVEAAEEIINEFERSAPRPHLPCIMRSVLYHQIDDIESSNIAETCRNKFPNHPEVLTTAAISAGRAGRTEILLSASHDLYKLVKSPQTIILYISALWSSKNYKTIVNLLRSEDTKKLPELDRNRWIVRTLLATNSDSDAVDYLNWLRDREAASLQELISLSQILLLVLDKPAEAHNVIADAISRYPDHPEPYLLMSRLHMLNGNRIQAFSWARRARDRFPNDPNVAANLWIISFPTGYEDHKATEAVWADIAPGGRLYTGDFIRPTPVTQFLEWLKGRSRAQIELERVYYNGRLSLPLLCYFQGLHLFDVHKSAIQAGSNRYVSIGERVTTEIVLCTEIVLDITALFTLWSLFKDRFLEELASSYKTVWIPTSIRPLLISEQNEVISGGQRARYDSQTKLRDLIESASAKFIFHNFPEGNSQNLISQLLKLAEELETPFLQESQPPEKPFSPSYLNITDILGLLEREGLLTPEQATEESREIRPPLEPDNEQIAKVRSSRKIVTDLATLTELTASGVATLLVDYLNEVHLAVLDRNILLSEIASFERRQLIERELKEIRNVLRIGEEKGIFCFTSAPMDERFLEDDINKDRQFDTDLFTDTVRMYITYLDELLWIIHNKRLPLWSDDLWTRSIRTEQRRVKHSFSTDAYLHCRAITNEGATNQEKSEYLSKISKLLAWGYQVIPINPEFIRWRLGEPTGQVSALVNRELEKFRAGPVNLIKRSKESNRETQVLAQKVLNFYQDGIVILLRDLFEREFDLQLCSDIFSELDLVRYAETAEGWEYAFYSSFYSHLIMTIPTKGGRQISDEKTSLFISWTWDMFLNSGVKKEALEYAWFELLQKSLEMINSASNLEDKKIGKAILGHHITNMPYQAWDYLVRTHVGRQIEKDFQITKPAVLLKFEAVTSAQPMVATVNQQQWETDIEEALDLWIADPGSKTVVNGSVAIYPRFIENSIPLVQVELIPAEFLPEREILRGEFRFVGLLHGIAGDNPDYRRFIWEQGLELIESTGENPEEWHDFLEQGLLGDSKDAQETGVRALGYLLGKVDIFRSILEVAAPIGRNLTNYVLRNLSPDAVRRWINLPPLDSLSSDEWLAEIKKKIPEKISSIHLDPEASKYSNSESLFDRYGRNFLVGTKEVIDSLISQINNQVDSVSRYRSAELILNAISESNSRVHRAAGITLLLRLLSEEGFQNNNYNYKDLSIRVNHLAKVFLEPSKYEESETNIIALEQVLSTWFYERWRGNNHSEGEKNPSTLVYLSVSASSIVVDILASICDEELINLLTDQLLIDILQMRLINKGVGDHMGCYHPGFATLIDYPALFLTASLSRNNIDIVVDNADRSRIIKGIVERLSKIKLGMAWIGLTEDESSTDGILTSNITLLCERLGLKGVSQDIADWGPADESQLNLCMTPNLAFQSLLNLIKELPSIPLVNQELVLKSLQIGVSLHSDPWQELSCELYSSEILLSIIDNKESHNDLLEFSALLWLWRDKLTKELLSRVDDVLFALPGDEHFSPQSLMNQGKTLALISQWETKLKKVEKWLISIAHDEGVDITQKRTVFQGFIFDDTCRPKLRGVWDSLLKDESLAMCWEFRWLRHLVDEFR